MMKASNAIYGKTILMAGVVGLTALATEGAMAATCKDVYVKATNHTGKRIEVLDIDYYDYGSGKWRSEPTRNRDIPAGQVFSDTRNLELVGGENTRIRIEYKDASGNNRKAYSKKKYCSNGSTFTVAIGKKKVDPPEVIKMIPVDKGGWKRGKRRFVIKQVNATSFVLVRGVASSQSTHATPRTAIATRKAIPSI